MRLDRSVVGSALVGDPAARVRRRLERASIGRWDWGQWARAHVCFWVSVRFSDVARPADVPGDPYVQHPLEATVNATLRAKPRALLVLVLWVAFWAGVAWLMLAITS